MATALKNKKSVLPKKWQALAEQRCADAGERLTASRLAAYAELLATDGPSSAYELIAALEKKQDRKIAPLTVYRHLDFLMRVGLVHRIESTQSYLACGHPEHSHESQYLVCTECGSVKEVESKPLQTLLTELSGENDFQVEQAIVELKGTCRRCLATANAN